MSTKLKEIDQLFSSNTTKMSLENRASSSGISNFTMVTFSYLLFDLNFFLLFQVFAVLLESFDIYGLYAFPYLKQLAVVCRTYSQNNSFRKIFKTDYSIICRKKYIYIERKNIFAKRREK